MYTITTLIWLSNTISMPHTHNNMCAYLVFKKWSASFFGPLCFYLKPTKCKQKNFGHTHCTSRIHSYLFSVLLLTTHVLALRCSTAIR